MTWEELTHLSDRELLLLLHQRVEQLEKKVEERWTTVWNVLRWSIGVGISLFGLAIAGHAAHWW